MLAKPIEICHHCYLHQFRPAESKIVCLATPAENNIVTQSRLGCPHGLHTHPLPQHTTPPAELSLPGESDTDRLFRAAWRTLHRRPGTLPEDFDREAERRWLAFLPLNIPKKCGCKVTPATVMQAAKVGAARAWWAWALEQFPIDLTSRRTYHDSLCRIHNAKNAELDKPQLTPAHSARVHGCLHLFDPEEIAEDVEQTGPVGVYLNADWGLGDAVCLTASLRDAAAAYPSEYEFFLSTPYGDVFRNLPGVYVGTKAAGERLPEIRSRLNGPHHGEIHLIDFLRDKLSAILGRKIPPGPQKPHLVLGQDETISPPVAGRYWVLSCGHRVDITAKSWPAENWQAVISALPDVQFVRVGQTCKWDVQPPLSGIAADLTGKTSIRDLIRLIGHPNCIGVLGGESSAIHIAAGFGKRMVCIAGDRMLKAAVCYEGEDYLGDNGFACTGCVKYRVKPLAIPDDQWPHHDRSLCVLPLERGFASCMEAVKPADVIARIASAPHG